MQQKVQFFNSQSSFGSQSSFANSRYFDLTNQINEQVEILFLTLKRQFLPTKQLTNYDKIQYIVNRAKIIANDTIPQHINYLQKISASNQDKNSCIKNQQELKKLIKNFQSLTNDNISHKQFYHIYCKNNNEYIFMKKSGVRGIVQAQGQQNNGANHYLRPDVVQVNILSSRPDLSHTQSKNHININNKTKYKQKQLKQLQDQISRMKNRQQKLKTQTQLLINNQKLYNQNRVKNILQSIDSKSFSYNQMFKKQLNLKQGQLQQYIKKNNQLIQQNQTIKRKYQYIELQNQSLKDELAKYRKLQQSHYEQKDWDKQSVHSQLNASDVKDSKKMSNNIKKLQGQRDLLKNQLIKQRQKNYSQKIKNTQDQSKQLIRTKKYLQQKSQQYQQTLKLFDKVKVESIQLKQQNQILKKDLSTMKQSNQQFKSKYQNSKQIHIKDQQKMDSYKRTDSQLENSKVQIIKFGQYQGEGIEGIPYFQLLSKQFRIRFKRACLKEKQLLYKANSLEVGVITEFFAPNFIKTLVHLTNYGDKDIKNLKIKIMSPNQNKLECQIEQLPVLNSNQQIKTPVSCLIKNYPIGPVVLLLDYQIDVSYDIRLLLPAHIFKCVTITRRGQKMLHPTKFTVKTQKKICKDQQCLKQYFNCPKDQPIKVKIRHQHSNSSLQLDASYQNEQITISYEHIQGYNNFTQYFIKTLKAILQKQN